MRANRLTIKGEVSRRSDADQYLVAPGDTVIVSRGRLRSVAISCPDGCGERLTINLDPATGPAWRLYRRNEGLTLFPSIWRATGCESHFIIWNGLVLWCNFEDWDGFNYSDNIKRRVLKTLRADALKSAAEIADEIDETPWEVLQACRRLVRGGLVVSGFGKHQQSFKLARRK
jgi:uncharacterized protein DUF6527